MIELARVSKRYGEGRPVLVDVDLTIPAGAIFGVIGRSGAGKSSLLRLINRLEQPSAGEVHVDGVALAGLDARGLGALRRRIGMIFQNFGLLANRTIADNVALPLEFAGVPRGQRAARVAELLELVGLEGKAQAYPAQLSGGQRQRVGIARALATDPAILLSDEATSALDPETTRAVLALLTDLNRRLGLTIVLVTHEIDVVRTICDHVAVLDHGRVVETGPTAQVLAAARMSATRALLGEPA